MRDRRRYGAPGITSLYKKLPRLPRTEAAVRSILSLPIYGDLPLAGASADRIAAFAG